ncbi:MAG: DNA internalization-related competence protein ComEC/Rec2 [Gemmatimonadaceae bacterium]|nr:DNA internalization-related competence protein ComEC/Rec2 [Gemmatimonadaceae bacterium]
MPLLLAAAIAWVVGAMAGLAAFPLARVSLVGATFVLVALWRGRALVPAALVLLALSAAALGRALAAADAACAARAAQGGPWAASLRAVAAPGAFVPAELRRIDGLAPCRVRVAVAVRSGQAPAGSEVRISRAEPSMSDRGLLLREARIERLRAPGVLARWRARVAVTLDRRFGPDAPVVRSLLIADTRGLDPALRDRYADAGLVHLLSISGLHIAIVGGALLLLFSALRLRASAAAAAAVAVSALYVLAIGAPPPAVRSVTLFAATQASKAIQRPVSPWGSFALGALLPLTDLRTVLDLGWQLSVSGYAAVLVAARVGRRLPESWEGWRGTLARELIAGVLTTLVTAPLVAWHFGRLSLVAPLSNLAAGPIVSLLQPTLFLVMVLPDALGAAFVVDAARPLLRGMDAVASLAASLPGAALPVAPTAVAAAIAGVVAIAVLVAGWSRHPARPALIALTGVAVLAWRPDGIALPWHGGVELHLIDVGQGDAIALRSPRGRWVVVDAGRSWSSGDAGRATVVPYLRRRGGALALLVLTHPHADHIGGAASVLRALAPPELRESAYVEGSVGYRELLATAAAMGTRWQRARPGESVDIDGLVLEFLAPDSAWTASLDDPNEASTVVRARYGAVRFLLTGDAEAGEERWLLERGGNLSAEVLKVGHHGSSTSTTPEFLAAVRPRIALVPVGTANTYGHPSPEVMQRLLDAGATVLRTDQLGTVILRTDGATLEAEAGGVRWRVARPLPDIR